MNEPWLIVVGALCAGLPLVGALITVMVDRERWIKLAYRQEGRETELIRWLIEDCKSLGKFHRAEGNVISFTKK